MLALCSFYFNPCSENYIHNDYIGIPLLKVINVLLLIGFKKDVRKMLI